MSGKETIYMVYTAMLVQSCNRRDNRAVIATGTVVNDSLKEHEVMQGQLY